MIPGSTVRLRGEDEKRWAHAVATKARQLVDLQLQIGRLGPTGPFRATIDLLSSGAKPVSTTLNGYQAWTLRLALQAQHANIAAEISALLANPPAAVGIPALTPATDTPETQPPGESLSGGQENTGRLARRIGKALK